MVIQAVVDHKYQFLNVYTGWPGSVNDARVFAHSTLHQLGTDNKLLPDLRKVIEGTDYLFLTWLMKPFPHKAAFQLKIVLFV